MRFVQDSNDDILIKAYSNVTNMAEVRSLVFDSKVPVCLVNPSMLWDELHLHTAIAKAVQNGSDKTMRTKQFGTEILYWLSPSTQITESLRSFGVTDSSTDVILVCVGPSAFQKVQATLKGSEVSVQSLLGNSNRDSLMTLFGIDATALACNTHPVVSKTMSKEYIN